jgi:hypothetical protein
MLSYLITLKTICISFSSATTIQNIFPSDRYLRAYAQDKKGKVYTMNTYGEVEV